MSTFFEKYKEEQAIAVAVSGGPDSMALAHRIVHECDGPDIHLLTVDHGLRADSSEESQQVSQWVKDWPKTAHHILRWDEDKPETKIMEEARRARYALMAEYCKTHRIKYLFLAHHMDDQAETFLLRLAAGSGLDGLAAMHSEQKYSDDLTLVRPLLSQTKEELITYCKENDVPYLQDPTNAKTDFARPRLRAAREILEEEGLTNKRLSVTAARLARARAALEHLTDSLFEDIADMQAEGILLNWSALKTQPEELVLRLLMKSIAHLYPEKDYAPRLEKLEDLMGRLLHDPDFNGATLGGCKFAWQGDRQALYISKE